MNMANALKTNPQWEKFLKGAEIGDPEVTPYSNLDELQIHIKGFYRGKHIEARYGKGKETLFIDMGLNGPKNPALYAEKLHYDMIKAPRMKAEWMLPNQA